MIPATYNFTIVRGSTTPFVFRLLQGGVSPPTPIAYDDVRLSVGKEGATLYRKTLEDATLTESDPLIGEITWTPTPAETRQISKRGTYYEVEIRMGSSEEVYLRGTITGIGGANDDD